MTETRGAHALVPSLRITILIRDLGAGGAQRQAGVLASALSKRGHAVRILAWYGGGLLRQTVAAGRVRVDDLGKRSRWHLLGPAWRGLRVVRRTRPDVLYGMLPDGSLAAAAAAVVVPQARVVWGVRSSRVRAREDGVLGRLLRGGLRLLSSRADLIIANSEAGGRSAVAAGLPAERIAVIPNGIDTVRFRPDVHAREMTRAAWGVPPDMTVVGLVGRMVPMKDHRTFLAAAAAFLRWRRRARFVCVGDGPAEYRARLVALAAELGLTEHLVWIPSATDMTAVYNGLDLHTSSSVEGEGFSNAIGEAMACGVRCAVTDVGDSASIVGDTGLVWEKGNPVALAAAWTRLLEGAWPDPRARIEAGFGVATLADRTERALAAIEAIRASGVGAAVPELGVRDP